MLSVRYHQQDQARRRHLIKHLSQDVDPAGVELATILAGCTPSEPCRSGACPLCGRAFQQAAFELTNLTIREPARAIRDRMTSLTIVSAAGCVAPHRLTVDLCHQVVMEALLAFDMVGMPPTIAAIDVSYNEDEDGRLPEHWCVHVHGNILGWLSGVQKEALRDCFPRSSRIPRPVEVEPLDLEEEGRLYPFKPDRVRRVSYTNTTNPDRGPFRDSHRRDLRPEQSVVLAKVMHELGFGGRLITHGIPTNAVTTALNVFYRAQDGP